ncbi:MAG TPA: hypothetical protein PK833_07015, partial [Vicingus sp.]|nr:hypothetical protein [Vicingus sp.]
MMRRVSVFFTLFLISLTSVFAQKKDVQLEDIWKTYSFYARQVGGIRSLNNGVNYTSLDRTLEGYELVKYSYADAKFKEVLLKETELKSINNEVSFEGYEFNQNETKLMIVSDEEGIYRHSSKAFHYIY